MKEAKELCLTVPWGHIAAKAWGSPTEFPVLCVHGMLDNAGVFDRLIAQLPSNYYYVSIDLPGHGLSTHFSYGIPLDFYNYVLSLRYVIEELKWKTFNYIGHSLGGQLGTFYSVIYPDQIQRLILIEGMVPRIVPTKRIITQIRKVHDATVKIQEEPKPRLYTYDEVMYTLRCKRGVCLNTDAAKALFKRSVSEVGGIFKYNRDIRLKGYVIPLLNLNQMISIVSQLKTKVLIFLTTSTLESMKQKSNIGLLNTNFFENLDVIYIDGNHDIHNNHPERIATDISKFLDNNIILSKL